MVKNKICVSTHLIWTLIDITFVVMIIMLCILKNFKLLKVILKNLAIKLILVWRCKSTPSQAPMKLGILSETRNYGKPKQENTVLVSASKVIKLLVFLTGISIVISL